MFKFEKNRALFDFINDRLSFLSLCRNGNKRYQSNNYANGGEFRTVYRGMNLKIIL